MSRSNNIVKGRQPLLKKEICHKKAYVAMQKMTRGKKVNSAIGNLFIFIIIICFNF